MDEGKREHATPPAHGPTRVSRPVQRRIQLIIHFVIEKIRAKEYAAAATGALSGSLASASPPAARRTWGSASRRDGPKKEYIYNRFIRMKQFMHLDDGRSIVVPVRLRDSQRSSSTSSCCCCCLVLLLLMI